MLPHICIYVHPCNMHALLTFGIYLINLQIRARNTRDGSSSTNVVLITKQQEILMIHSCVTDTWRRAGTIFPVVRAMTCPPQHQQLFHVAQNILFGLMVISWLFVVLHIKPQTHGEREARSYKNLCAQESDITISLALWTADKCCKSSKLGKIASSRLSRARYRARHVFLWKIASRFSLLACRVFAALVIPVHVKLRLLVQPHNFESH